MITEIEQKELPPIGAALAGGFYNGLYRDQHSGDIRALITAGKAAEIVGALGTYGEDITGAQSYTDGHANTAAYAEAGSELAQKILQMTHNDCNDWAYPARDQQELQYRHFKPTAQKNYASFRDGDNPSSVPAGYPYTDDYPEQTTVEAFREGGPEAFSSRWYGASTQYSPSNAWCLLFDNGSTYYYDKGDEFAVRPVRSIKVINSSI